MQVVMLEDVFAADRVLLAKGSTPDLPDAVALDLLGTRRARPVVPPARLADARSFGINIWAFGDSITHNAVYTDGASPDGKSVTPWFVGGAANNYYRAWGWLSWVGPMSMQRAQVIGSSARQTNGLLTAGSIPAGVPLCVQVDQALVSPAWSRVNRAVIMIGFNDTAFSIAACASELLAQIARIGKPVDLLTPPPRSDGTQTTVGGDGMQGWAWLAEWRATLRRIADASGGWIRYIDGYSVINSPTATPDAYAAGHSYDTTHPNNVGAYKIADAYVASLFPSGLAGDLDIWPTMGSAASAGANGLLDQGFANPTFGTASGGTGTGVIAGSLTVTNSGASHNGSVAACTIPGGVGNMQSLAMTAAAAGDYVNVAGASCHAAGGTFLAAGDQAWAQCLVRVNGGGIYPRSLRLLINGFQSPTNYYGMWGEIDPAKEAALPLGGTRTFLLRTPVLTMPPGAAFSVLQPALRAVFAGAGSCTIDLSNLEVRRFRGGGAS